MFFNQAEVLSGAGADERAAMLQHFDSLLQEPGPDQVDQVRLHAALSPGLSCHPQWRPLESCCSATYAAAAAGVTNAVESASRLSEGRSLSCEVDPRAATHASTVLQLITADPDRFEDADGEDEEDETMDDAPNHRHA